jgi:hypothetical protein
MFVCERAVITLLIVSWVFSSTFPAPGIYEWDTDEASAASGDVILFWDTANGAVPAGWTCISCLAADPMHNVFPRAAAAYGGATTSADTVTHTATFSSQTANNAVGMNGSTAGTAFPISTHTHTWGNPTLTTTSIVPEYQNLNLIKKSNPTSLPQNIIAIFDTASIPSGWTRYSSLDGKYLRANATNVASGTPTHTHGTVAGVTSGNSSGSYADPGNGLTTAAGAHNHTIAAATAISSDNNTPPYIDVVFAKLDAAGDLPNGMLAFFDAAPPTNWESISTSTTAYYQRFLRGASSPGGTGGSATHTHGGSSVLASGVPSATANNASGALANTNTNTHTHSVTYTIGSATSLPVYRDVIVGKYTAPPITVSGTLYSNEGSSQITTAGKVIALRLNGISYSTTTISGTGFWQINNIAVPSSGNVLTLWVDGDATTRAAVVTKANGSSNITALDLYQNRVIIRHEGASAATSTTNTDLDIYDGGNDSDIQFTVTGGNLAVNKGQELHVWTGKTFSPGGEVTLHGNAASSPDGDFHIDDSAIFVAFATTTVAGNWSEDTGGAYTGNAKPLVFNATTTGKTISGTLTDSSFLDGTTTFNGVGGEWTFSNNASTSHLIITNGTVVAPPLLTVAGHFSNAGTFTNSLGTVFFSSTTAQRISGTLTGTSGFASTTFIGSGTKTLANNASTTNVTMASGAGAVIAPALLSVSGNYSNNGTFTHNSGTTYLSGASQQTFSGTMTSPSAFNNVVVLNTSGSDAQTSPSIIFSTAVNASSTFTAIQPSTKLRFLAGATSTLTNISFNGQAVGTRVTLRSSSAGTAWKLAVPGTRSVLNTDVKDSAACSGAANIDASDNSNVNSTGNTCWTFPATSTTYTIKHTPYLQLGNAPVHGYGNSSTEDQIEIMWQTLINPNAAATSTANDYFKIDYRKVSGGATTTIASSSIFTIATGVENRIIHYYPLTGLSYDSDYDYAVIHYRDEAEYARYAKRFHTRLATSSTDNYTFVAYGDAATTGSLSNFISVQDRVNTINPRFAVLLGDNVYTAGTHTEWDMRLDPTLNSSATDWNSTHIDYFGWGNHDLNGTADQPAIDNYSSPKPELGVTSGVAAAVAETPEHNYSFDYGNVHFVTIDSNGYPDATRTGNQVTWAEDDLASSTATWKIVFVHFPIISASFTSTGPSSNYYQQIVSRLKDAGADVIMAGHAHTYERSYPLTGQSGGVATITDTNDNDYAKGAGFPEVVSGLGGNTFHACSPSCTTLPAWLAVVRASNSTTTSSYGVLKVDVTPSRLTFSQIKASDGTVEDTWYITAGITGANVQPASLVAGAAGNATVSFTTTTAIPSDGKIVVTLPSGFTVNSGGSTAASSLSGIDGSLAASVSGNVITLTRSGGTSSGAGAKSFVLSNIKNPTVSGSTGTYQIKTTTSANATIEEDANVTADTITAGTLTSTNVQPASLTGADVGDVTVSFTSANPIPPTGKIAVTLPTSLGAGFVFNSGASTAVSGISGLDGTLSLSIASNVATLTRGGGASTSTPGAVSFTLSNIKNPDQDGSTGTYSIVTKNASDTTIDQDTAVTADTISNTPVATWWNGSWGYRRKITLNNSAQAESLSSFPILVSLNSSRIDYAKTSSGGIDLRFVDSNNITTLDYHIEKWDSSGTSTVWVDVPQVDGSSNTDYIYMYYGNGSAVEAQNEAGTWNSGYEAVWHFASTSGQYADSTGNNFDSDAVTVLNRSTSTFGGGFGNYPEFGGGAGTNFVTIPTTTRNFSNNNWTLEAYIKSYGAGTTPTSGTGTGGLSNVYPILTKGMAEAETRNADVQFFLGVNSTSTVGTDFENLANPTGSQNVPLWSSSTIQVNGTRWYYIAATADASTTALMKIYIDGMATGTRSIPSGYTPSVNGWHKACIGCATKVQPFSTNGGFKGNIDEIRISNVVRSADWIAATDKTLEDTFNTYASEEAKPAIPTIVSAANQLFTVNQSSAGISTITITDDATTAGITAANDIRIAIASSSINMKWLTSDTSAVFGGTASGKVSNPVSYESSGTVLVVPVSTNFSAGDTLTISGLSFSDFTSGNPAVSSGLGLHIGGVADATPDASDTKTITIRGRVSLGSHTAGQIGNKFDVVGSALTDVVLYGFKIIPTGESTTISSMVFKLSDIIGFASGDITNAALYIDYDSDGVVDAADTAIGGTGSVSIASTTGTITFSSSFTATTTRNYILEADVAGIGSYDEISVSVGPITATGASSGIPLTTLGSVLSTLHRKVSLISRGIISDDNAVAGQQVRGGGSNRGGEVIGDEPGYIAPTALAGGSVWTTPANAYESDGAYATHTVADGAQGYGTFTFNVPNGNTIVGIEVKIEGSASTAAGSIDAKLSWNNGSSVTSAKNTGTLTTTDTVYTLGGSTDTWGRSWSPSEFSNANFRLQLIAQPSNGNTVKVDAVQIKVYHQATGGSNGGGGGEAFVPGASRLLASVVMGVSEYLASVINSILN